MKNIKVKRIEAEYVPTVLRDPEKVGSRETMYAIGEQHGEFEFGMWYGPVREEKDALEIVGQSRRSVLIAFLPDGTSHVKWKWASGKWVRVIS